MGIQNVLLGFILAVIFKVHPQDPETHLAKSIACVQCMYVIGIDNVKMKSC